MNEEMLIYNLYKNKSVLVDELNSIINYGHDNIDAKIAQNLNCPIEILTRLSNSPASFVRNNVASNSNSPDWILRKLSSDNDSGVRRAVFQNSNCPLDLLEKNYLSNNVQISIKKIIAKNPNCSLNLFKKMSIEENVYIRKIVASNLNCPQDILNILSNDDDLSVKLAVASNPNCSVEILKSLSKEENNDINFYISKNFNCSNSLLRKFSANKDLNIRINVAKNPNCPEGVLRKLSCSTNEEIKCAVAENINCPDDILTMLSFSDSVEILKAVAKNPNCPNLKRLSYSSYDGVRFAVAENPNCPDDILKILAYDDVEEIRLSVISHPKCPSNILDKYADYNNPSIRTIVAKNTNCSQKTLEKLSKDFLNVGYVAKNSNCSIEMLNKFLDNSNIYIRMNSIFNLLEKIKIRNWSLNSLKKSYYLFTDENDLIELSKNLNIDEEIMLYILDRSNNVNIELNLLNNNITIKIINRLIKSENEEVKKRIRNKIIKLNLESVKEIYKSLSEHDDLIALSKNPNIDEEIMLYILDKSNNSSIETNIINNKNVTFNVIKKLLNSKNKDIRKKISDKLTGISIDEIKEICKLLSETDYLIVLNKNGQDYLIALSKNPNIDEEVIIFLYNASRNYEINRNIAKSENCPKKLFPYLLLSMDEETSCNVKNNEKFSLEDLSDYRKDIIQRKFERFFFNDEWLKQQMHYELYESTPTKQKQTREQEASYAKKIKKINDEKKHQADVLEKTKNNSERKELLESRKSEDDERKLNAKNSNIELRKQILEILEKILENNLILDSIEITRVSIPDDELFESKVGYKVIKEEYLKYLNVIDLSSKTFENVKICGTGSNKIDYSKTNANFDLRKVYNMDASNCIFSDMNLYDFKDFEGINIFGSVINEPTAYNIEKSIYDENTIFNGEYLVDIINRKSL